MPLTDHNGDEVKFADAESFINFIVNAKSFGRYRRGQLAFNLLLDNKPFLANKIRGQVGIDPFYQDENLPNFFRVVNELWNHD